jgi:hypothetical protein
MDEMLKNKLKSQKIKKQVNKKQVSSLNWSWTYFFKFGDFEIKSYI